MAGAQSSEFSTRNMSSVDKGHGASGGAPSSLTIICMSRQRCSERVRLWVRVCVERELILNHNYSDRMKDNSHERNYSVNETLTLRSCWTCSRIEHATADTSSPPRPRSRPSVAAKSSGVLMASRGSHTKRSRSTPPLQGSCRLRHDQAPKE